MKKVLTIGLMLLVCAGFVFAADDEDKTDTLTVQIKIEPYTQAEWFETVPENNDWTNNGDIVDELTSDQIKDGVTYFAAVRTNNSTLGTITIDAAPLKITTTDPMYTDNTNEYIKYSVRPHTDSDNDNKDVTGSDSLSTITDTQKTVAVYKAASSVTGARFMYAKIDVQVDSTSYANASAGTYEASLIMTLSAQ